MPPDDILIGVEENPSATSDEQNQLLLAQSPEKKKRKKGSKGIMVAEVNKKLRLQGKDYLGRKQCTFDQPRRARKIQPRCSCRKKSFWCSSFSESRREELFKWFWDLTSWKERRIFIKSMVQRKPVKERKTDADVSRRSVSLYYYLNLSDEEDRVRVCKYFFLNTLCLGEWTARNWASKDAVKNCNRELSSRKKTELLNRETVSQFIDALPKLESHYCRKSTSKLYLECNWRSMSQVYDEYKNFCTREKKDFVSRASFIEIFKSKHIGIFSPKKDACDVCCSYKTKNINQEEYDLHIKRKKEVRQEKDNDKANTSDEVAVFTMDLQAVLLAPKMEASALYYRTKLKVHNFTIYNLKTQDGRCYLWDESEGGLSADEFATIIFNFVCEQIGKKKIILYSDGCTYQNRNSVLANALLLAAVKMDIEIFQKFLEKGHTQMECDSMHSTIERALKNREIYIPSGYIEVCRTARKNPKPYEVVELDHTYFKKFSALKAVSSLRPGNKPGDPVVTEIREIWYKKTGEIEVKIGSITNDYEVLPRRIKKLEGTESIPSLYKERLPITGTKFKHLQEMKYVLPRDTHSFYDLLPKN